MKKDYYTTRELTGAPVYLKKDKGLQRLGKVHSFVFHPNERRVIGFSVKRPDVALMFHRSDKIIAFDDFEVEEEKIVVSPEGISSGRALCKRFGVKWDECVIWRGLQLLSESGEVCGHVGSVKFSTIDGSVKSLFVDRGASALALLGTVQLPAEYILGFKLGVGENLASVEGEEFIKGALIVSDEALLVQSSGGLAEKAGFASARVSDKVGRATEKVRPVASETAQKAGETLNKGAYALGSQIAKTKGMFSGFKEAYRKASAPDDEDQL